MKALKVLGWMILIPIVGFAAIVLVAMIEDSYSSDQTRAAQAGMSIRECISTARTFGADEHEACTHCEGRVPK